MAFLFLRILKMSFSTPKMINCLFMFSLHIFMDIVFYVKVFDSFVTYLGIKNVRWRSAIFSNRSIGY